MNEYSKRLVIVIEKYRALLQTISDNTAALKPNPLKWSKKELLGHLIDSAANNHQRFVRIQDKEDLIFEGYNQDFWVKISNYQNENWNNIISLWYNYNLHLAQIIGNIADEILYKTRTSHNLHQIAFKAIPEKEPTTLVYFIEDYIDHMKYHLDQIFEDSKKHKIV